MKKTNLPTFSFQDYFKLSAQSSQKAYDKTACTRKKYTLLSLNPIKINNVYMEMNWWSVFVQHLTHWPKKNSQIHVNSNELVFTFHFFFNLFISLMGILIQAGSNLISCFKTSSLSSHSKAWVFKQTSNSKPIYPHSTPNAEPKNYTSLLKSQNELTKDWSSSSDETCLG